MRLFDLFLDQLSETRLFEMAFDRKKAIEHADSLEYQLSMHMIKLLMFEQRGLHTHWCKEVNIWFWSIQLKKLKATKKPLPYRDLMKCLHEGPLEWISQVQEKMNYLSGEYPDLKIVQPDAAHIHKLLIDIYSRVCFDISREKFAAISEYL